MAYKGILSSVTDEFENKAWTTFHGTKVEAESKCLCCDGTGEIFHLTLDTCPICHGSGRVFKTPEVKAKKIRSIDDPFEPSCDL